MENVFAPDSHSNFSWDKLGDITKGRPHLGPEVPVKVYRIFEYAVYDVLCHELGQDKAQQILRAAGYKAGWEFAHNVLELTADFDSFLSDTAAKLLNLQIGVLRVEKMNRETGEFTVTVAEDLDCSGLQASGEEVCNYDEGFLSAVFESYTGNKYDVREIDCWASGDKVCRFVGVPQKS